MGAGWVGPGMHAGSCLFSRLSSSSVSVSLFSSSSFSFPASFPALWRWRVRGSGPPEAGPSVPQTTSAELFYLRHGRRCCTNAWGCNNGSGACGVGSHGGRGGCGFLGWCPTVVLEGLGAVYAVVAPTGLGCLHLLASAGSPGFWLPLAEASGVVLFAGSCGQAAAFSAALASASGHPVLLLAARAALLEGGVRTWVGSGGVCLWALGFHWRSLGLCRFCSLVAAGAGFHDLGWGTLHACQAAWQRPAFPDLSGDDGMELDGDSQPAVAPGQRSGVRVAKWYAESKADRHACSCRASNCRGNIEQRSVRVRSAANTSTRMWYHPGCVEGGLGPYSEVQGTAALDPPHQDALRAVCDQHGKPTRAQFVADVRRAKRVRSEGEFGQGAQGDTLSPSSCLTSTSS